MDKSLGLTLACEGMGDGAMAMRMTRGLLRLWLVLSVCWIILIGVEKWMLFPPSYRHVETKPGAFDPNKYLRSKGVPEEQLTDEYLASKVREHQWTVAAKAAALALVPPALALVLGTGVSHRPRRIA